MAFTRNALLLKWSGGSTERAFMVKQDGYHGGVDTKPASYQRSMSDGSLLIVRGVATPRRFVGIVIGEDSPTGSTGGVDWGSIAELKAAHAATDLQAQSFEDAAYWDAEWAGDWDPQVSLDPMRNRAEVQIVLEGR